MRLKIPLLLLASAVAAYGQSPTILNTDENQIPAGRSALANAVNGSGFVAGSVVYWDNTPLATTFESASRLRVLIPASLLAISGKYTVTVRNPGAAASNGFPVYVHPVLTAVFPASAPQGAPSATIVVTGIGFSPTLSIRILQGPLVPTTYVNSTTLSGVIPASALSRPAVLSLYVGDSVSGVVSLQSLSYSVGNPPLIGSLSPASAAMGDPGFTLTVNGAGFLPGATVHYNGDPIPTTFASPTRLTATVQAALLTQPGSTPGLPPIWVVNPDSGLSNSLRFTVNPPTPVIVRPTPASAFAGGPGFTLTVDGAGFFRHSVIWFNGVSLTTTFVSAARLTAAVPAILLFLPRNADLYVYNTGFEAPGISSNHIAFPIDPPSVSSFSPPSVKAGSPSFTLTVNGLGFTPAHFIEFNLAPLPTAYVSPTQLSATVPSSLVAFAGTAIVKVVGPGGPSSAANFLIDPLPPIVAATAPTSIAAGSPTFTLTVRGQNFVDAAVVQWNGSPLATTFVSSTQLAATVPAALIATAAAAVVSVTTRAGLSNPIAFTVLASMPTVHSDGVVNAASSQPAIAPGSLITIYGANLVADAAIAAAFPLPTTLSGASVTIDGVPAPLLYASPGQINAQVPIETILGTTILEISRGNLKSVPVSIRVTPTAPGTLTIPGTNRALTQNASPARPGQYVTVYLTGQGAVDNRVATGEAAPASPLSRPLAPVRVRVGGQDAEIQFAGLAPGFAGLLQINLKVPALGPGEHILEITIGDAPSNPTTLSIAPD